MGRTRKPFLGLLPVFNLDFLQFVELLVRQLLKCYHGLSHFVPFTSFRCEFLSQLLLIGTKIMKGHLGVWVFIFLVFGEWGEVGKGKEKLWKLGRKGGK